MGDEMNIPQRQLARTRDDLTWLAAHDAFRGVAEIIAERRRQIEDGDEEPGKYAAESALNFGESAKAGALCAWEIDREVPD